MTEERQLLVASTLAAAQAAFPVHHAIHEETMRAQSIMSQRLAAAQDETHRVDARMSEIAETFEKLPHYTEKLKIMASNLIIVRENVAKLRSQAREIGRDAKEYCVSARLSTPELDHVL
jgi:hypothetical protein